MTATQKIVSRGFCIQGVHSIPKLCRDARCSMSSWRRRTQSKHQIIDALNSFGVNHVGARQSQHARRSRPLTEEGKLPRNEKEDWGRSGTCLSVHQHASGHQALSFPSFPHPEPLHLRYLNMSGTNFFAGAHHFVASNNTFESKTVSGMFTK
jgi:hypothetical protein